MRDVARMGDSRDVSADLHLKLEADPERLSDIADAIEELGAREGWPPDFLFRMNLVLEEMSLNVMTHGRSAGARELEDEISYRYQDGKNRLFMRTAKTT